jgi:hypothetical protein
MHTSLHGFMLLDVETALSRVGGDRRLLRELLHLAVVDLVAAAESVVCEAAVVRAGGGGLAQVKALRRAGHAAKGCAATVELRAVAAAAEALLAAVRPLDDGGVGAAVRTAALRRIVVDPATQAREFLAVVREAALFIQRDSAWRAAAPLAGSAPPVDGGDAIDALIRAHPWLGGGWPYGAEPGAEGLETSPLPPPPTTTQAPTLPLLLLPPPPPPIPKFPRAGAAPPVPPPVPPPPLPPPLPPPPPPPPPAAPTPLMPPTQPMQPPPASPTQTPAAPVALPPPTPQPPPQPPLLAPAAAATLPPLPPLPRPPLPLPLLRLPAAPLAAPPAPGGHCCSGCGCSLS